MMSDAEDIELADRILFDTSEDDMIATDLLVPTTLPQSPSQPNALYEAYMILADRHNKLIRLLASSGFFGEETFEYKRPELPSMSPDALEALRDSNRVGPHEAHVYTSNGPLTIHPIDHGVDHRITHPEKHIVPIDQTCRCVQPPPLPIKTAFNNTCQRCGKPIVEQGD